MAEDGTQSMGAQAGMMARDLGRQLWTGLTRARQVGLGTSGCLVCHQRKNNHPPAAAPPPLTHSTLHAAFWGNACGSSPKRRWALRRRRWATLGVGGVIVTVVLMNLPSTWVCDVGMRPSCRACAYNVSLTRTRTHWILDRSTSPSLSICWLAQTPSKRKVELTEPDMAIPCALQPPRPPLGLDIRHTERIMKQTQALLQPNPGLCHGFWPPPRVLAAAERGISNLTANLPSCCSTAHRGCGRRQAQPPPKRACHRRRVAWIRHAGDCQCPGPRLGIR